MGLIAGAPATLCRLRREVAKIEGQQTDLDAGIRRLALGVPAIDLRLQGGLAAARLHEIAPPAARDAGAVIGFALALATRAQGGRQRHTLWIQTDHAAGEAGNLYGPGCDLFGLPAPHLLILKVPRPIDALWAMEEALKSRALASVVAELPADAPLADLTATRRLTVAAREGEGFALLLRHRPSLLTSSAETRWEVAALPGKPDRFGGLGRTAFVLSLVKNRCGPTGRFVVAWDHHDRIFSALPLGLAAAIAGRPDRAQRIRAG